MSTRHERVLREAAARRSLALASERAALDALNVAVREARAAGVSVIAIAAAIGTTRQRVYEILRSS